MVKVLLGIERFCDILNYERKQLLPFFKYKAAYKRTQQFPTLLAQYCWELLRLFERSLRFFKPSVFEFFQPLVFAVFDYL